MFFWGVFWSLAPAERKKIGFWVLQNGFSFGAWLRRPGGQGGFRPPPYAPPGPPIPPSNGRGIPPDPPCPGRGTSPCVSTDRVRIGHAIWFGLGPATNRAPGRARTLHGPDAGARTAAQGCCRGSPLPTLQGQSGVGEPGEGSAAPKATVALPGTDVNLAGRAPARLAVHCSLATGGPGAAMFHAPFGRPRHPLGTFPCGKVPRPPAGGRNLPQETDFLWLARERALLLFPFLRRFRLCGGDQRAFRSPFGNLRGPPLGADRVCHKN